MEEQTISLLNGDQTVTLELQTKSEDFWPFDEICKVQINLTHDTIVELLKALEVLKNNSFMGILVGCWDPVRYLDDDGKKTTEGDWRSSCEHFIVYKHAIYFHAEHKHNSGCYTESESFIVKP